MPVRSREVPVEALLVIAACLVASAFFSGSETALLRLRSVDLTETDTPGAGPARSAIRALLQSTSRLLVTILIGNNVVNILGAAMASALAVGLLGPGAGVAVATVVMTLLVLVLCEILPKAMAAAHPVGISRLVALPLYLFHQLLRPAHGFFDRIIDPLVAWIAGGTATESPADAEQVLRLAREARLEEQSSGAAAIIGSTARAAEMTVQEVMVARPHIFALPVDLPADQALERMLEERYTRVPVYTESIDSLAGIVHLKDLVRYVRDGGGVLREVLRPLLRVPERKPILDLLAEMQRGFVHMAIVKDEHGLTEGLVTTEDILEELVGEIRDEYDREELQTIQARPDGAFEAMGRVKVLDFNRATGWELPAERGDSLSGLVFNELGRPPRRGDRVIVDGHELEVLHVSGTRIGRVLARRLPAPAAEE
jgi:putative hemolysin